MVSNEDGLDESVGWCVDAVDALEAAVLCQEGWTFRAQSNDWWWRDPSTDRTEAHVDALDVALPARRTIVVPKWLTNGSAAPILLPMTTRPRRKIPTALRNAIFARDGKCCVYCGRRGTKAVPLTLDHVIPHSEGGPDTAHNLVTACGKCNTLRATFPIDLFAVLLARRGYPGAEARVLAAMAKPLPK